MSTNDHNFYNTTNVYIVYDIFEKKSNPNKNIFQFVSLNTKIVRKYLLFQFRDQVKLIPTRPVPTLVETKTVITPPTLGFEWAINERRPS